MKLGAAQYPLVQLDVVGAVDQQLAAKGLKKDIPRKGQLHYASGCDSPIQASTLDLTGAPEGVAG